jgi:hypothetical protein
MFSVFAKATYATAIAALGSLASILVGGYAIDQVSAGQWVAVALVGLAAGGGVYGIPNGTFTAKPVEAEKTPDAPAA